MQMEVVDCQAATVEKLIPVDTTAPTVQKDMVNPVQATKERPTTLIFRYKMEDPNSKIIPFLPNKPIEKSFDENVTFGRTLNFDVFLNDECMSRDYIRLYAERNNPSQFKVINVSNSKCAIVDNNQLWKHNSCYIEDKSVIKLDTITFSVSIQYGDKNAQKYVVWIKPQEIDYHHQLSRISSFQMQNFGTFHPTCCHNSSNNLPSYSQIYNSSNNIPVCSNLNKKQPNYFSDGNIPSGRQPQEHEMASEDDFHLEKQKQYQYIEDLAKK